MNEDRYISPFSTRYAGSRMQYLFSEENKVRTWRRLWVALARAEHELGLPVSLEQVRELEAHTEDLNLEDAHRREKECRHDVMSHVYAYGLQCPKAAGIIHLGATSCYVGDNGDLITMRSALRVIQGRLLRVMRLLDDFAWQWRACPALAYTHLQPAQLTTVGKRACLWLNDLLADYREVTYRLDTLPFLGCKGTTGTQASFMELFDGDEEKIRALDRKIAREMGFADTIPVSGQTYSRKVDYQVLTALSGIAQTASKFAYDLRLLSSFKEMEEPFEEAQIGSSAMPYKRNPMRCERINALARQLMCNTLNPALTASCQMFERTLDDSANRRIAVAEGFLCADALLNLMENVCGGLVVYEKVIARRVEDELPFMATENILMDAVKRGGNRQQLHEKLRVYAREAGLRVKRDGAQNDLMERVARDPDFRLDEAALRDTMKAERYTGRCASQVEEFLEGTVRPLLRENEALAREAPESSVTV